MTGSSVKLIFRDCYAIKLQPKFSIFSKKKITSIKPLSFLILCSKNKNTTVLQTCVALIGIYFYVLELRFSLLAAYVRNRMGCSEENNKNLMFLCRSSLCLLSDFF